MDNKRARHFPERNIIRQSPTGTKSKSIATIQLQVSNPYGIACFTDLADEMQKRFNVEKNEKNRLYAYLMYRGLASDYAEFIRYNHSDNLHETCLNHLELFVTNEN